jgi:hypothetical protein
MKSLEVGGGLGVAQRVLQIGEDLTELVGGDQAVFEVLADMKLFQRMVVIETVVFVLVDAPIVEQGTKSKPIAEVMATREELVATTERAELTKVFHGEFAVLPCLIESFAEKPVVVGEHRRFLLGDHAVFENARKLFG